MAAQMVQTPLLQAAKAHQLDIKILCNDQPQGLEKRNQLLVLYRFSLHGPLLSSDTRCCLHACPRCAATPKTRSAIAASIFQCIFIVESEGLLDCI